LVLSNKGAKDAFPLLRLALASE